MKKNKLLIATTNPGKIVEIRALLAGLPLICLEPESLGVDLKVAETGETYQENAEIKAAAYLRETGLITLADDSGLEVDALDGRPGVLSARFAPWPGATDADRRDYLRNQLVGHPQPWKAHFYCVAALAHPQKGVEFGKGVCSGMILDEERGEGGFGYDPIFYIPELGLTTAQLSKKEKNQISHRALAVQALLPQLSKLGS